MGGRRTASRGAVCLPAEKLVPAGFAIDGEGRGGRSMDHERAGVYPKHARSMDNLDEAISARACALWCSLPVRLAPAISPKTSRRSERRTGMILRAVPHQRSSKGWPSHDDDDDCRARMRLRLPRHATARRENRKFRIACQHRATQAQAQSALLARAELCLAMEIVTPWASGRSRAKTTRE